MEFDKRQNHANGAVPEFGAIFMTSGATKSECLRRRIFGLPSSLASFVEQVKVGMLLFLFDFETKQLHGVFQACSDGAMNIVPHAFSSSGRTLPAQVKFTMVWHCAPLSEEEFGEVIQDNYFTAKKFNFGLSEEQVCGLLSLFREKKMKLAIPKKQLARSRLCSRLTYANGAKDEHHIDSGLHSINDARGGNDNFRKVERVPAYERLALSERIHSSHKGKSRGGSSSFDWHLRATTMLNQSGETEDFHGDHGVQSESRPIVSLEKVACSAKELRNAPDFGKLLSSERLKENRYGYGACWPNSSCCVPVHNYFNHDASVHSMKTNLGASIRTSQSQPRFSSALSQSVELPQHVPCSMSTEDSYLNGTYHLYNKASSVKYGNPLPYKGYHVSKSLQEMNLPQKHTVDSIYPCREKQSPSRPLGADLANGIFKSSSLLQSQVPPRTIIDHEKLLTTDEQFPGPAFHENPILPYGNECVGDPSFSMSSSELAPCSAEITPPHILGHRKSLQSDHMYDAAVQDTCLHNIQYGRENLAYESNPLQDSYDHLLEYRRDPSARSAAGYSKLGYSEKCFRYSESNNSLSPKRQSVFTRLALPSEMQLQKKYFSSSEDDVDASPDEIMAMLCSHRTQGVKGNKSSMPINNKHHGKRAPSISIKAKRGHPEGSSDKLGMSSIHGGDHQSGDGPFLNFKRRSELRKDQDQIDAEDTCQTLPTKDGEMVEEERPFLDFKSRSKLWTTRMQSNAEGHNVTLTSESLCVAQVKRRKLIRPDFSFDKKGAPDEGCTEKLTSESPSVFLVKRKRIIRPDFSSDRKDAPEEDFSETSLSGSLSAAQAKRKKLIRPNLSSDKKEAPDENAICASDSQLSELKSHDWFKMGGNNKEVLLMSQSACKLLSPGDNDKPGINVSGEKNSSICGPLAVVGNESLKEPLQDFCMKVSPLELLCKDKSNSSEEDTSCKNLMADGSDKESNLFSDQEPLLLLQKNKSTNSGRSVSCKDMVVVGSGKRSSMLTGQPVMPDSSPETCGDTKTGQMVDQMTSSFGCSPAELTFIPCGETAQSEMQYAGSDDISSKSKQCSNFGAVSKEKECELSLCLGRQIF